MNITMRTTLFRVTLAAAVSLGVLATAAPAQAHDAPKPGTRCAVSGMTEINHGDIYVCTSARSGAKPRWGKGQPISRSPLTLKDGWAKAAQRSQMTAGFGTLRNPTRSSIRIIGAYSPYADVLQLHQTVQEDGAMSMQQKIGGFVIPAGGMLELKPGGNHVMFMKLTRPIKAGSLVPVTFVTSDGGLLRAKVLGKVFSGANETYSSGMSRSS